MNTQALADQLVGQTSNQSFILYSTIYYFFMFNIWFQQIDDLSILVSLDDH